MLFLSSDAKFSDDLLVSSSFQCETGCEKLWELPRTGGTEPTWKFSVVDLWETERRDVSTGAQDGQTYAQKWMNYFKNLIKDKSLSITFKCFSALNKWLIYLRDK